MKKIIYSFLLLLFLNTCSGYKPIFISTSLQFEITNYSIEGDKTLGNKVYAKLNRLSKSNKNEDNTRNISFLINATKSKKAAAKDSTGKILSYKITLNTKIEVKDSITDEIILNQTFVSSTSYKIQDQISDTAKLENKYTDNLIDKTYRELLIQLSQNISTK